MVSAQAAAFRLPPHPGRRDHAAERLPPERKLERAQICVEQISLATAAKAAGRDQTAIFDATAMPDHGTRALSSNRQRVSKQHL